MPIVFVRLERRNVDPRFTEHTRLVTMPRTEIEHGITTNVQPLRPVLRIRNVKVGVAAAAENRDDIGGPQRAASHPAAAEGPISQHVRVVPLKMEIHAQQVQHCPCKLGLHRGYGDGSIVSLPFRAAASSRPMPLTTSSSPVSTMGNWTPSRARVRPTLADCG